MSNISSISPINALTAVLAELSAPIKGAHPATALEEILAALKTDAQADAVGAEVGTDPSTNLATDVGVGTGAAAAASLMFLNVGAGHAIAIEVPPVLSTDEIADNKHTLQDMAKMAPRHDIATQRHGPSANNPKSSPSTREVQLQSSPAVAQSSSRPDAAGANPVVRQVKITADAALLLHLQPTEFRTTLSKLDPTKEARKKRDEKNEEDASSDADFLEDEDLTPDLLPEINSQVSAPLSESASATPSKSAFSTSMAGDAQLYQNTVACLNAVGALAGPTFDLLAELRSQRRVVIATPHGLSSAHAHGLRCEVHVDLLWPVPGGGRALRLRGEILWTQAQFDADWFITHLVKSQSAGGVRQLSPKANQEQTRQIAVCLGAQALPMVAWSHACLRIHDGNRLWRALEPQWSLRLAVSTLPLTWHQQPHGAPHAA
jgi:hypothetical protein